jgi:hypothetical protein
LFPQLYIDLFVNKNEIKNEQLKNLEKICLIDSDLKCQKIEVLKEKWINSKMDYYIVKELNSKDAVKRNTYYKLQDILINL